MESCNCEKLLQLNVPGAMNTFWFDQSELIHTGACSVNKMEVCATFTPENRIIFRNYDGLLSKLIFQPKGKES